MVRAVSRPNILLLESIHATAHEEFARHGVVVHSAPGAMTEPQLVAALQALPRDRPVMLGIRSKTQVTPAVLDAVPQLLAVGAFCIGTDQIALAAARARGIAVFNAPFSNTRSVAELVLAPS